MTAGSFVLVTGCALILAAEAGADEALAPVQIKTGDSVIDVSVAPAGRICPS